MWRRRLFWRLFLTYSLITVFCTAVVGVLLVRGERRTGREQLEGDLAQLARVLDERFAACMDPTRAALADSLAKRLGAAIDTRITVIQPDGRVLADTNVDPMQMENHRYRPEVQAALQGQVGSATRLSKSDFAPHLYVAVPSSARTGWVVRVAIPMAAYQARLREATSVVVLGGLLAGALSLLLGYVFMRRIVRPLEEVGRGLERLERGEFGARVPERSDDEIGTLARTLNRVEERLEATIQSLMGSATSATRFSPAWWKDWSPWTARIACCSRTAPRANCSLRPPGSGKAGCCSRWRAFPSWCSSWPRCASRPGPSAPSWWCGSRARAIWK